MNSEHIVPQIIMRSWPWKRGAARLGLHIFGSLKFKEELAKVRTSDGVYLRVMPNDLIGRFLYLSGKFERDLVQVLLDQAETADVLLDIGAHIGYVSSCALATIPGSKVIAVEPQSHIGGLLEQNLSQFCGRYQIAHIALSSEDGEGFIGIPTNGDSGSARLAQAGCPITIWSVSTLIEKMSIERADLIKIDVEGHEAEVIAGLIPFLSRLKTRAILFEDKLGQAIPNGALGGPLRRAGFDVFCVLKRFTRLDLIPVKSFDDCGSVEYLALQTH